jgi:hypothetical protein
MSHEVEASEAMLLTRNGEDVEIRIINITSRDDLCALLDVAQNAANHDTFVPQETKNRWTNFIGQC